MANAAKRPPFDSLPYKKGDPPFSAWGLYGDDDQLGALNLLTAENTLKASSEIKTGTRISLDPRIDVLKYTLGERRQLKQIVFRRGAERPVHDDEIEFNTQVGAQWDGFRHLTYLEIKQFYGGIHLNDISGPGAQTTALGIHSWVEAGGIVGRGILLDYYSWSQAKGKSYKLVGAGANYAITTEELLEVAKDQGTEIQYGDILFVRSGFWIGYAKLDDKGKRDWADLNPVEWVGVEQSAKMAGFLWNNGITACAGDAPGWEKIPNYNSSKEAGLQGLSLHEIMLGGWGMPIGEMFDLETLSEHCKKINRWSFFVTSAPLHVPGGVGSPPNCIAIF